MTSHSHYNQYRKHSAIAREILGIYFPGDMERRTDSTRLQPAKPKNVYPIRR